MLLAPGFLSWNSGFLHDVHVHIFLLSLVRWMSKSCARHKDWGKKQSIISTAFDRRSPGNCFELTGKCLARSRWFPHWGTVVSMVLSAVSLMVLLHGAKGQYTTVATSCHCPCLECLSNSFSLWKWLAYLISDTNTFAWFGMTELLDRSHLCAAYHLSTALPFL